MSERIQTKYESAGLFLGPTPATGQHFEDGNNGTNNVLQIHRVQSFNDTWELPSENVNQFGQAVPIDRVSTTSPTPTFDFSYNPTNGINEYRFGFPVDGTTSIASGIFDATSDSKNFFALFTSEGSSAVGNTDRADHRVIALGNGFISNWDISASVGGFMEANVSVEGSNYVVHADSSGNNIPAINPANGSEIDTWQYAIPVQTSGESSMPTVIQQGGITVESLPGDDLLGVKLNSANLQSFNVSVPFAREALERLGNQFVFARPLQTPIDATVSLDFSVTELATGTLASIFNNCTQGSYDFEIKANACLGGSRDDHMVILVKGARPESENTSMDIGSARNGSINFTVPIGTADDTNKGIFLSGSYNNTL